MSAKIFRPIFNDDGIHSTRGDQCGPPGSLQERPPDWYDGKPSKGLRAKIIIGVVLAHSMFLYGCNAIDAAVDYNLDEHGFRRHVDTSVKMCEYRVSNYRTEFRPCNK